MKINCRNCDVTLFINEDEECWKCGTVNKLEDQNGD